MRCCWLRSTGWVDADTSDKLQRVLRATARTVTIKVTARGALQTSRESDANGDKRYLYTKL